MLFSSPIEQYFSNFTTLPNHQESLLKGCFWFSGSGRGQSVCQRHSGDADADSEWQGYSGITEPALSLRSHQIPVRKDPRDPLSVVLVQQESTVFESEYHLITHVGPCASALEIKEDGTEIEDRYSDSVSTASLGSTSF